jgi:hypothetical protein
VQRRGGEVAQREQQLRQVEAGAQGGAPVALAHRLGPLGPRLVLQHLAARQLERALQRAAHRAAALAARHEAVEHVEVDLADARVEPVGIALGDDQLVTDAGRAERGADVRDVGLERRRHVPRQRVAPEPFGEAVLRHRVTALEQQDLEDLLRLDTAELARSEDGVAGLDGDGPEQPDADEHLRLRATSRAGSFRVQQAWSSCRGLGVGRTGTGDAKLGKRRAKPA